MKNIFILIALFITLQNLQAITGTEVMQNVDDRESPETAHTLVQMDLIDKNGTVNSRVVENWSIEDSKGLEKSVLVFHTPASVKNTRFLMVENEDRDDDKWIYLPALKKVRRIASSEESKSFMGTDFTYDDISTREVQEDYHEILREETVNTYDCYVVESRPKDPGDTQYSRVNYWISKDIWMPIKIEFYDKKEKLLKIAITEKLEKIQGYWSILANTMKNVQTGHATTLEIMKVVYDEKINSRLFTTRFLETGKIK